MLGRCFGCWCVLVALMNLLEMWMGLYGTWWGWKQAARNDDERAAGHKYKRRLRSGQFSFLSSRPLRNRGRRQQCWFNRQKWALRGEASSSGGDNYLSGISRCWLSCLLAFVSGDINIFVEVSTRRGRWQINFASPFFLRRCCRRELTEPEKKKWEMSGTLNSTWAPFWRNADVE